MGARHQLTCTVRFALAALVLASMAMSMFGPGWPVTAQEAPSPGNNIRWRSKSAPREERPRPTPVRPAVDSRGSDDDQPESAGEVRRPARLVSNSPKGSLPSDAGQQWQEYDIARFTQRMQEVQRPEQSIVDWILRETGFEIWHQQPSGFLTADREKITVYHTPAMQAVVADVVERFVHPEHETIAFSIRVITINNPNWRAKAQKLLKPIPVETQGVQAWLMGHEDCAMLFGDLRRRNDYREHSSPNQLVYHGESTVVSATRPRSYVRDIVARGDLSLGYETELGTIDEGFSLELAPLVSADGTFVDAMLKCRIDQLERLRAVTIDTPTSTSPRQKGKIEVPQVSHCRVLERFRWPVAQTLIVGLGVMAPPTPVNPGPLKNALPAAMAGEPPRADLLVVIESRGKIAPKKVSTARKPRRGAETAVPSAE